MGITQKVKDVAHKIGLGHSHGVDSIEGTPAYNQPIGSSYTNVGATYGAEGATGIAAPVDPGYATTASDEAAAFRTSDAGYTAGANTAYGVDTTTTTTTGLQAGTTGVAVGNEGAVCSQEYYTKVEDRPVYKERVTTLKEHRPVEKEFVVETRATGNERDIGPAGQEHVGSTERIVSVAQPGNPCD